MAGVGGEGGKHLLVGSARAAGQYVCHEVLQMEVTDRYGVGVAQCLGFNECATPWSEPWGIREDALQGERWIIEVRARANEDTRDADEGSCATFLDAVTVELERDEIGEAFGMGRADQCPHGRIDGASESMAEAGPLSDGLGRGDALAERGRERGFVDVAGRADTDVGEVALEPLDCGMCRNQGTETVA